MSSTAFYQTALNRELSEPTQKLFEVLLARNEQIEEMFRQLPDRLRDARGRREGRVILQSPREMAAAEEKERQARTLEGTVKTLVTLISSEYLLLKTAVESEKIALKYEREGQEELDPLELELNLPIFALREANIEDLNAFRPIIKALKKQFWGK